MQVNYIILINCFEHGRLLFQGTFWRIRFGIPEKTMQCTMRDDE